MDDSTRVVLILSIVALLLLEGGLVIVILSQRRQIADLLDRLMSKSFPEYRAFIDVDRQVRLSKQPKQEKYERL